MLSLKMKHKLHCAVSGASFVEFVCLKAFLVVVRTCGSLEKAIGEVRLQMKVGLDTARRMVRGHILHCRYCNFFFQKSETQGFQFPFKGTRYRRKPSRLPCAKGFFFRVICKDDCPWAHWPRSRELEWWILSGAGCC